MTNKFLYIPEHFIEDFLHLGIMLVIMVLLQGKYPVRNNIGFWNLNILLVNLMFLINWH